MFSMKKLVLFGNKFFVGINIISLIIVLVSLFITLRSQIEEGIFKISFFNIGICLISIILILAIFICLIKLKNLKLLISSFIEVVIGYIWFKYLKFLSLETAVILILSLIGLMQFILNDRLDLFV